MVGGSSPCFCWQHQTLSSQTELTSLRAVAPLTSQAVRRKLNMRNMPSLVALDTVPLSDRLVCAPTTVASPVFALRACKKIHQDFVVTSDTLSFQVTSHVIVAMCSCKICSSGCAISLLASPFTH